jgi:hypothetical protein
MQVPKLVDTTKIKIAKIISLFSSIKSLLNNRFNNFDNALLLSEKHLNVFNNLVVSNK